MAGPTVSRQKIEAAVHGDHAAMRELLTQVGQVTDQQQAVTGTTPQGGTTPGKVNPAAPVPVQAVGSVSQLSGSYIVELVNPGGTSPISQLQARQAAGNATILTPLQPVTPIYHQIRASTSPAFNVNSNTKAFGGNTGSTQTRWTLTELGGGTWYFQFRSSFDGVNWNKWKNANGGAAFGGLISQVTTENAGNSEWALFTMPGSLTVGVGAGVIHDGSIFDLATEVVSSGMIAIAGPNGYDANGNGVYGLANCDVDIQVPATPAAGTPDYPVQIAMKYGSNGYTSPGTANVFAICFDPTNPVVKLYAGPGANWVVLRLPGGAHIAIGQGKNNDGATIWTPGLPWMNPARAMGVAVPTDASSGGPLPIAGIQASLAGFTLTAKYELPSGGGTFATTANWMCIAWETGAPVQTVGVTNYLTIGLQGGHAVVIGKGGGPSGTPLALPGGFSSANSLSIAVPSTCDATGNHLRGVQRAALLGITPLLFYSDNSNVWQGHLDWIIAAWK